MIEVRMQRSTEYAAQMWRDNMRTRIRHRWLTVPIGIGMLALSGVYLAIGAPWPVPATFGVLGAGQLVWHWWDRARWFAIARRSHGPGPTVLRFHEEGVETESADVSATIRWSAFREVVLGREGLFLAMPDKNVIYVPFQLFRNKQEALDVATLFDTRTDAAGATSAR